MPGQARALYSGRIGRYSGEHGKLAQGFRIGRLRPAGSTALVVLLGAVAFSLVPFLKYPATPPAVGSGETIDSRTALYFGFVAVSVLGVVAAVEVARIAARRWSGVPGVLAGATAYVVVVAVAALAFPKVDELGTFPASVLWDFRVSSLLTLLAMIRIWMGVFWNPAEEPGAAPAPGPARRLGGPPLMVIPAVALVACSVAIAVAAGPLFSLSERTAQDLLHPSQYVQEVLGP